MIMITVAGCADTLVKMPGANEYAISFKPDWSVFDSGTFIYGPEGSTVRQIGGHRLGYLAFYDLTLDFSFKDGRTYHEVIDVNALMKELVTKEEIFDLRNHRWGGFVTVLVRIEERELTLDYRVTEQIFEPDYEHRHHYYPLYRQPLD